MTKKAKVYLGVDRNGYSLKAKIREIVESNGYVLVDLGVFDIEEQAACSDIAREVSEKIVENFVTGNKEFDHNIFGILISDTGTGMMIAANRMKDIRAIVANDPEVARLARCETDANILCLGKNLISEDKIAEVVLSFLNADCE